MSQITEKNSGIRSEIIKKPLVYLKLPKKPLDLKSLKKPLALV